MGADSKSEVRRLDETLEASLRGAVNPAYVDMRGTASHERAALLGEIDFLREECQRHSHLWRETQQDNDLLSEAIRGLLQKPGDAQAIKFAQMAIGVGNAEV